MTVKHGTPKTWSITPSGDGKRWSAWPAGDKPGGGGSPPSWVTGLSSTNTVYAVGEDSTVLASRIQWPGLSVGADLVASGVSTDHAALMYAGSDNNPIYCATGYGSSVYCPEVGAWGAMVLCQTGEHSLSDQLNGWALDDATYSWFQQPLYARNSTEADSYNADWYFSPSEFAALAAGAKLDWNTNDAAAASWYSTWVSGGKNYNIGYGGWIIRRKYGGSTPSGSTLLGNNRPHWMRYSVPCYVPSTLTGTGYGALVTSGAGAIYGPFNTSPLPSTATASDWFAETWGDGSTKYWLHAMNVTTKAWTRLPSPVPQAVGFDAASGLHSCVDEANKRIYFTSPNGTFGLYYADISSGLATQTFVGKSALTMLSGDTTLAYNNVLCVPTSGPNAGKRLWYFQDLNAANLVLIDIDAMTCQKLAVTGLPSGSWRFGYDKANNLVYLTVVANGGGTISCYRFAIPTGYTSAGNYTLQTLTLNMNGNSVAAGGAQLSHYGQRSTFINGLGVILVPQRGGSMLAFKPA